MSVNLVPAELFMKQYSFTDSELLLIREKNNRAVLMLEGRYFVNTQEVDAHFTSEEIFLSLQ